MTLSAAQKAGYDRDGFLAPIRVLSETEVADCETRVPELIARITGDPAQSKVMQFKVHLLHPWLDALVRHPAILDAVESLIGPDILVWNSGFLVKKPRDVSFVSWHQDATYWGLEPMEVASAWLALRPSHNGNGCVRCIPGSHKLTQLRHRDTHDAANMLSRGQTIDMPIDEASAVPLELDAGEMSLHHVRTIHGSQPNPSDTYRIGFIVNYIAPQVRQTAGPDSAMLVRGQDRFGHFESEPRPAGDLTPEGIAAQRHAMDLQLKHILK